MFNSWTEIGLSLLYSPISIQSEALNYSYIGQTGQDLRNSYNYRAVTPWVYEVCEDNEFSHEGVNTPLSFWKQLSPDSDKGLSWRETSQEMGGWDPGPGDAGGELLLAQVGDSEEGACG